MKDSGPKGLRHGERSLKAVRKTILIRSREVMPYGVPLWTRITVGVSAAVAAVSGILPKGIQGLLPLSRRKERAVGGALHRSWSGL